MATNTTKRILIILSSASELILKNGKKVQTGFFLSELMVPVQKLKEQGCRITYANATGIQPSMDPLSDSAMWFGFKNADYKRTKDALEFELLNTAPGGLKNPIKFSEIQDDVQLQTFDAVFVPGGHAPLMDLPHNLHLARILLHFHDNKKPTAMICHGPISILSTALLRSGDKFPYLNYHMTCYSDAEEGLNEMMWFDKVPLKMETDLKHLGCLVNNRWPLMPNVIVDEELITEAKDASGRNLAITQSGGQIIVDFLDYTNANQMWEKRKVADNQYAYVNKASGQCIARNGYNNGSALIPVTVDQIQMSAPKTVWREEDWHGYKGINSLSDWEQKFNIPGNGPYHAGQALMTWSYSGADPNECWSFVEENTKTTLEKLDFNFNLQQVFDMDPVVGQTQVVVNDTDATQTQKTVFAWEDTQSTTFTDEHGLKITESVEFTGKIPAVGEMKVGISVEGSVKFTTSTTTQSKKTVSYEVPVNVPAHKKIMVESIALKGRIDVPYAATIIKTYPDGSQKRLDLAGTFRNVNTVKIITNFHEI